MISPKLKRNLGSSNEECKEHSKKAHCDPQKDLQREHQEDQWNYKEPKVELTIIIHHLLMLRKPRDTSAPGRMRSI